MNCPLCLGKDKKIDNSKLIFVYKRLTDNNFSYLFSEEKNRRKPNSIN